MKALMLSLLVMTAATSAQAEPKKPAEAAPMKDRDKLTVKRLTFGDGKAEIEMTVKADKEPLSVTYGPLPNGKTATFEVAAGETVVKTAKVGAKYNVKAKEGDKVVDEESPTKKTGIGGDTKLK